MLSNYVSKLGKNIWVFNLPRTSCNHKTELCDRYCYARKGRWFYGNVKKVIELNLSQSQKPIFADLVDDEIKRLVISKSMKYMRIHSIGDFYNQRYYNKWEDVARRNPEVKFLAYTRNWELDTSAKPSNFKMYFSIDRATKHINPTIRNYAYAIQEGEKIKGMLCQRKCYECKHCYEGGKNVTFQIH